MKKGHVRTALMISAVCLTTFNPVVKPEAPLPSNWIVSKREPLSRGLPFVCPSLYLGWVINYCDETGTPVWVACRMFSRESSPTGSPTDGNWQTSATSWAGAEGIAQLMPEFLSIFSKLYNNGEPINTRDPETSICVGIRYLADLYGHLQSWRAAIGAYNCGIMRYIKGSLPEETILHMNIIMGKERNE